MFLWLSAPPDRIPSDFFGLQMRFAGQDTVFLVPSLGWTAASDAERSVAHFLCVEQFEILSQICGASRVRFRRGGIYSQTLARKKPTNKQTEFHRLTSALLIFIF